MRTVRHTEYVEKLRDTVVYVNIPTEVMQQVKTDSSHLETSMAFSDAWLEKGLLFHTIKNKPRRLPVAVSIKDTQTYERNDSVVYRDVYIKEVVERRHIPKSYWFFMAVAVAAIVWIIGRVYVRIFR